MTPCLGSGLAPMRGSGFMAFGLLTITVAMGIANLARWQRSTGARAVTALIHRNASLLSVVFLAVHVVTAVADKYVTIPIAAVMVPGLSGYGPVVLGLGAAQPGDAGRPDRHQPGPRPDRPAHLEGSALARLPVLAHRSVHAIGVRFGIRCRHGVCLVDGDLRRLRLALCRRRCRALGQTWPLGHP